MPGAIEETTVPVVDLYDFDEVASDDIQQPTETPAVDGLAAPVVEVVEPKFVQLKEDEYHKLLKAAEEVDNLKASEKKIMDTVYGRVGRALEEFKSSAAPKPVTIDDFPGLKDEHPEIAKMQVQAINAILSKQRIGDPAAAQALADQSNAMRLEFIDSQLDSVVPDWNLEVKKPEFHEWAAKQDASVQALIASPKVRDAAKMLRLYAARTKAAPAPVQAASKPAPAPAVSPQLTARQQRLQAAVQPKGTGGNASPTKTAQDEMDAGYSG